MTQPLLGAHVPWAQIDIYLNVILELGLVPEIAIKGPDLDSLDQDAIRKVSECLANQGLRPRVHAPFFDLNPGSIDSLFREATYKRLDQALHFAGELNAELMVLHPGVDKWRYPNLEQVWLENACNFFPPLVERSAGLKCKLVIENIYEESPALLVDLVNRINSPWFGHCFDVGHWHLFGRRPLAEWLESLHDKLFHLHLHDNHGRADEHLPVGSGKIDFMPLKRHLSQYPGQTTITLEAHRLEHLKLSLQNVNGLLLS